MFIILLIAIIFVLAPVAQAYAKRLNAPDVPGIKPADLARLREEMDLLAAQVNRLQDEQSFMLKLLSENPPRREIGPESEPRPRAPERLDDDRSN